MSDTAIFRCASCQLVTREPPPCPACGAATTQVPPEHVVDGRYVLAGELGRGGMGQVYRAVDVDLERQVALKVVLKTNARALEGLRAEAAALGSLHNEHVVGVYAFGPHLDGYFFAMEYVRGASLDQILATYQVRGAFVPIPRAVGIVRAIADGLAAAHRAGILHRDVKPANVVIEDRTGRPVLIDFGLALAPTATQTNTPGVGTPLYMPPEHVRPGVAPGGSTPRSDVYSLGCVAFELLTSRRPFEGDAATVMRRHATMKPPDVSSLRPGLAPFDAPIARALAKDPAARFASTTELSNALAEAEAAWREPEQEPRPSSPPRSGDADEPLSVLVVDDDPVFCKLAVRCAQLALYGRAMTVRPTASGAEAIQAARRNPPDLVLLDHDMPGQTGIDTLAELRALPDVPRARVVVVSAAVGDVERWRFGVMGVSDFVQKPVSMPELVQLLTELAKEAGWI